MGAFVIKLHFFDADWTNLIISQIISFFKLSNINV